MIPFNYTCSLKKKTHAVPSFAIHDQQNERLQTLLHDTDIVTSSNVNFEPIPLPLDPTVMVKSIIPDKSSVFSVS